MKTYILFFCFVSSCAWTTYSDVLKKKATYLCESLSFSEALNYNENFASSFRSEFNKEKVDDLFKELNESYGKCKRIVKIDKKNVILKTESGEVLDFWVSLDQDEFKFNGLKFLSSFNTKDIQNFSEKVCHNISKNSKFDYQNSFHKDFKKEIPKKKIDSVFHYLFNEYGPCNSVNLQTKDGQTGTFVTTHPNKVKLRFSISLKKENTQSKISGLVFTGKLLAPVKINELSELKSILDTKEGSYSFLLKNITDDEVLYSYEHLKKRSLGSVFKLYILGTLKEKMGEENLWQKNLSIKESLKSLPGGVMQNYENGSLYSTKEFATKMISISDNTATDHLLNFVGPKNVYSFLSSENLNSFSSLNHPFLSSLDFFKARAFFTKKMATEYANSSFDKRLKMLKGLKISRVDLMKKLNGWKKPRSIDEVQWFASANDICALYKKLDSYHDKDLYDVLSVNTPFVDLSKSKKWNYAGYKGGSEPGVLEMSYLLKGNNNKSYCLYLGGNNPKNAIKQEEFMSLIEGIFIFLEN